MNSGIITNQALTGKFVMWLNLWSLFLITKTTILLCTTALMTLGCCQPSSDFIRGSEKMGDAELLFFAHIIRHSFGSILENFVP